jgi:hypothetical protein
VFCNEACIVNALLEDMSVKFQTRQMIGNLNRRTRRRRMNPVVIEHVKISELPDAWRTRLAATDDTRVTVRIETEPVAAAISDESFVTDDPAFGIWRDRDEVQDVAGFVRSLRAARYNRDGTRRED